ncbi:MAG TPA: glycosyltransferase family 9 protein [Elusimicrobiales bacterium]|nr:glycosyltransferase family 9 protein [Elusimicrobiales bacterium]
MATEPQWIDPTGGLGDVLLLSGVLKLVHDRTGKKYNMIRRTSFTEMLAGHPAIDRIDYLPAGAPVMPVKYGLSEEVQTGGTRAFQMLAKMFGLELPAPETLYLPMDGVSDTLLADMIPWREKNVAIVPDSTAPKKMMPAAKWEKVAKALADSGALVVQFGKKGSEKIKYSYSLAGVTTPKEAILLLKRMDLLITPDSFLMHAAHMTGTPAISLWGPTEADIYGYPDQQRLVVPCQHGPGKCRVADFFGKCSAPAHCMDKIDTDEIVARALKLLGGQGGRGGKK